MANEDNNIQGQNNGRNIFQEQRNMRNNSNNIKNVAMATKNPNAVASDTAINRASKATGGKSAQSFGQPIGNSYGKTSIGKKNQSPSNRMSVRGKSNRIGKAASIKNGMVGGSKGNGNSSFGSRLNKKRGVLGGIAGSASNNDTSVSSSNNQYNGEQSEVEETRDIGESTEAELKVVKKIFKILAILIVKIVLIIAAFFIFLLLFIVVMLTPLIALGIIDLGDLTKAFSYDGISSSGSYNGSGYYTGVNYVETKNNSDYWWPIGSAETTTINGVLFASGQPIGTRITSTFGLRNDPMGSGTQSNHGAIDIVPADSSIGTGVVNIIASKDGIVSYPKNGSVLNCEESTKNSGDHTCGGWLGNYVVIKHDDGMSTKYGHMYAGTVTVKDGDHVKQGQVIGKMGSSGNSTGRHLHFAIFSTSESTPFDPEEYVSSSNPRPNSSGNNFSPGTIPLSFSVVRGD